MREITGSRWFPSQRTGNAESVSIAWRHDVYHNATYPFVSEKLTVLLISSVVITRFNVVRYFTQCILANVLYRYTFWVLKKTPYNSALWSSYRVFIVFVFLWKLNWNIEYAKPSVVKWTLGRVKNPETPLPVQQLVQTSNKIAIISYEWHFGETSGDQWLVYPKVYPCADVIMSCNYGLKPNICAGCILK